MTGRGVVAAGHPESANAGAAVLRAGGNAVDAAVAAVLTSFAAEPLLTGLGSGGYLLVVPPGGEAVLLDFFVETPGRGPHVVAFFMNSSTPVMRLTIKPIATARKTQR